MNPLGSFIITAEDSEAFARASGDYNPLHLDPVAARRTRFGHTLIHGVCGTLKALDLLVEQRKAGTELLSIKVKYSKPVAQGQHLTVLYGTSGAMTRLEILADDKRCQIIEMAFGELADTAQKANSRIMPAGSADACVELTIESCRNLQGEIALAWDQDLMDALFPSATRYIPQTQLAALLASTRIVGMRCPGLHSIFAQLDLRFTTLESHSSTRSSTALGYKVIAFDPRIDRVELSLQNDGVHGNIEAFFRSPPVQQASFTELASLVSTEEFSNQHALVIGASRGLGEIITKVLAAGGAKVSMTYAAGREDAERVSREIGQYRAAPTVFAYDVVTGLLDDDFIKSCSSVTHVYYLASPLISKTDSGQWDPRLFSHYCSFYIDGLATLLQHVERYRQDSQELRLFIPSTIFLEKGVKGFDEYIAAKAAAETFLKCYENSHRHCSAYAPRLPRLHTDQTAGIKHFDKQQTLAVVIAHLRHASGGTITGPSSH